MAQLVKMLVSVWSPEPTFKKLGLTGTAVILALRQKKQVEPCSALTTRSYRHNNTQYLNTQDVRLLRNNAKADLWLIHVSHTYYTHTHTTLKW